MVLNIILGVLVVLLAIAYAYQLRVTKKQSEESADLLRDYQRRLDEQQRLFDDYQRLEKQFNSVGQGYEKALLAFDKLEEEKQTLNQVKEALLKQVHDLQQVNGQLQAELQQAKTTKNTADETTLR